MPVFRDEVDGQLDDRAGTQIADHSGARWSRGLERSAYGDIRNALPEGQEIPAGQWSERLRHLGDKPTSSRKSQAGDRDG
jgi:hypothetical protein